MRIVGRLRHNFLRFLGILITLSFLLHLLVIFAPVKADGDGWYLDGAPVLSQNPFPADSCSYFGFNMTISNGSATGSQSCKNCSNQSKCGGTYTGTVTSPAYMQPGSKINFTMSEKTTAQNTCAGRNTGSGGWVKI